MSNELATLTEVTRKFALLADTLDRRCAEAVELQQQAARLQQQAITEVRNDVNRLIESSGQHVVQSVQRGVESTLGQSAAKYDQALGNTAARLGQTGQAFEQAAQTVSANAHRKLLVGYAAIAGAMLLLIGGGGLLLWFQAQSYSEARARTAAAQIDAETITAYTKVGMTSCGGRLCVKLDAKSPHWGSKGEYVLLDMSAQPDKTSAKN